VKLFPDLARKAVPRRSRREEWRTAAALMRAHFIPGERDSKDEIVVGHGPWTVRVSTFFVQVGNAPILHTGAKAHFHGLRDLRLEVRRRNVFDRLVEAALGRPGRVPPQLQATHVVRGKPEARLPSIFSGTRLAPALLAIPSAELRVERAPRKMRRSHGDDVGVAWCRLSGLRLDPRELSAMVDAVTATLEALERVAEARRVPSPDAWEAT